MMELIDREKLLQYDLEEPEVWNDDDPYAVGLHDEWCYWKSKIMAQQIIDAVQVVRCKDCIHKNEFGCCDINSEDPDQYSRGYVFVCGDNFFCAYGERKER